VLKKKLVTLASTLSTRYREANDWSQSLILGLLSGVLAALIIISFRALIELGLELISQGDTHFSNFSDLGRSLWIFGGALILGAIMHLIAKRSQRTGIKYVLDTIANRGSIFTWPNTMVQFFGGAFAILTGQSVGREGPAVHLGAAASSSAGRWLMLGSPQLRLLAGCGVAAAIGASFNTPIAGVIFAMEVILLEYTAAGLFPIIVAASTATAISRWVYGTDPAFQVPLLNNMHLSDAPWLLVSGAIIGVLASAFIALHRRATKFAHYSPFTRFGVVGLLTAVIAYFIPEITGVGYSVVQANLDSSLPLLLLGAFILGKLILTPIATGVGIPGGLIAATLFIGACVGGLVDQLSGASHAQGSVSAYVIIGMGTMMSAVLNAPLSALTAVMELTYAPGVLMPTMVSIIVANIICRELLKQKGIFERPAEETSPWRQWAQSTPITRVMNTRIITRPFSEVLNTMETITESVEWVVLTYKDEPVYILSPQQLRERLRDHDSMQDIESALDSKDVVSLFATVSAWEALERMNKHKTDIAVIRRQHGRLRGSVMGIVSPQTIDKKFKDLR